METWFGVLNLSQSSETFHAKHGPIVSLPLGNSPAIFVASASLAHEALVQNAAVFAHRPVPPVTNKIIGSNQHNVSSAGYGPTWCLLRRNLTAKILNPLRLKAYSRAHKWVLEILFSRLRRSSETGDGVVRVVDDFHFAMYCLLVLMCFGDQLEEEKVREIEAAQLQVLAVSQRRDTYYLHIAAAVILEGLRRHPPGHFGLPHAVNQDVNLGGYTIPLNANIFFMVAEIAWNPEVWEDPLVFKPERFLTGDGVEAFDVTGSKEIKMMPFGAGRRVCPGNGLGIFHLEYFVAI
ncbi:unnamed protein product, partial [Vitis vinifera]